MDLQYSTVTMKLAGLEHLATWTYSIVQYSTVQYDVKNVTEGRGGKKGRGGPGSVFLVDVTPLSCMYIDGATDVSIKAGMSAGSKRDCYK